MWRPAAGEGGGSAAVGSHYMAIESNAAAAAAAIESGNWEQRSEASEHLVGNSGRRVEAGGRHQRMHGRPLSLGSIAFNVVASSS